jgi:hypothetical protein
MKQGWVKIQRSLLDWEWYDDINTKILFLHCLLKANHADKKYRGDVVKRGTFLTGRDLLSKETGLSVRQVRTALDKLESTNELTIKKSRKGSIVEVVNYNKHQVSTNGATNDRPTNDQQATSNKNDKNEKKEESPPQKGSYSKKSGYQIEPEVMARWEKSYPNIDIPLQLKKAHEWLIQHDWKQKGGKPYKSMSAFATNWLNRQDKEAKPKSKYGNL